MKEIEKLIHPEDLIQTFGNVMDETISLRELIWHTKYLINKKTFWDLIKEGPDEFDLTIKEIKRINMPPTPNQIARFNTVQWFIHKTANLRKEFDWEAKVQVDNWKKYLIIDKDNVYEVSEQIWNTVIAYDPIKEFFIIYNLENKQLKYKSQKEIIKTWIDWFYKIDSGNKDNLLFVSNEWNVEYLWTYKLNWLIKKHWNTVYFPHWTEWEEWEKNEYLIIKPSLTVDSFQWSHARMMVTLNWKNILCITFYNSDNDWIYTTMYDCDSWNIIIEKWLNVIFKSYKKTPDWLHIIWNAIKYDKKIPRFRFLKSLSKVKTDVIML